MKQISQCAIYECLVIFLLLNLLIFGLAIGFGNILLKRHHRQIKAANRKDWLISGCTVLINTFVTLIGFSLWRKGFITIDFNYTFRIIGHLIFLFFAMDFLMYIFHYVIHRTFLHRSIHALHHLSVHPQPIDLFVLHPIETIAFGMLWIGLLLIGNFSIYAIIAYLIINVLFGIVGHLGFEPFAQRTRKSLLFRYLGTSTFHHKHHEDMNHNFGFYTSIWDRIFGTYR
ncbi:sterol desaturase family protein [Olivibacter sp. SDN3]|uniref:sterol desaturase family protein n=1 Tax=Olivibacter sp. SDN3 TaxID=2764720 RepID=UPI002102B2C7|nr:sterol desaturase family protein [Olivibacter sp. SDN3]